MARGHGRSHPGRGRSGPRPAGIASPSRAPPCASASPNRPPGPTGDRLALLPGSGVAWPLPRPARSRPHPHRAEPTKRRSPAGAGRLLAALGPTFGPAPGEGPPPQACGVARGRRLRPPPAGPYRARSRLAWRTHSLGNQGGDNQPNALLNVIGAVPDRVRNRPERVSAFNRNGCPLSPDYTPRRGRPARGRPRRTRRWPRGERPRGAGPAQPSTGRPAPPPPGARGAGAAS